MKFDLLRCRREEKIARVTLALYDTLKSYLHYLYHVMNLNEKAFDADIVTH